jgi:GT2 family glycosyltransferase
MTEYKITICILHYNKLDRLKNTVEKIRSNTPNSYKIKILNNGYIDNDISEYLSGIDRRNNIEILYSDNNIGCPPGRNKLLSDINTPFAMTLDDDMYVEEGWLERALSIFEDNPEIGVVGIPYIDPKTDALTGGARLNIKSDVICRDELNWENLQNKQKKHVPVEHVPGGTMIFRREVLDDFQWDERYFVGVGDFDKDLQLMESDWEQVMAAEITFYHDITEDKEYTKVRRDYDEIRRSYEKFQKKWGYRYPLRDHILFKYFFALPWPIMNLIENVYQNIKRMRHRTI